MRILISASTYPRWRGDSLPGFVHEYCRELVAKGHSVTALVPHADGAAKREVMDGVEVIRYQYWPVRRGQTAAYSGNTKSSPKSLSAAAKIMALGATQFVQTVRFTRSRNVDVINPHWVIPQGVTAVAAGWVTRRPTLTIIHGGDVFTMNGPLMKRVKRWALHRSTRVAVNSSATLAVCKQLAPRSDYQIIPMGLTMPEAAIATERVDLKSRETTLLFIGRIHEEKGLRYLLQALAILKGENIKLEVAGTGPAETEMRELAQELGVASRVRWLGWLDRTQFDEVYQRADIFVGPSITAKSGWVEAFGLVFAESLARSVPVIGTKTGGIIDVVNDGENGFLIEEKSPEAIATAVRRYLEDADLYNRHKLAARDGVMTKFNWPSIIVRYEKLLRETIQATRRRR